MMDEDDFKYSDWRCLPDSVTIIAPCKKTDNYAVKFDTAENIALSLYDFSKAYFQSANIIASRMIDKEQIDELDKYVFPLFFLYRHSLELLLKSIGFSFIIDNFQRQLFLKETFHNLRTIYEYILKYTTCPRNAEEQQWLLTYFGNIEKSDSESDSFRYPFHIIVNYSERRARVFNIKRVFQKQTHLDLISEVNKFEAAHEILTAWYLDIHYPTIPHYAYNYAECQSTFLDEGGYYYAQSVVGYEYTHNDFHAYCSGYKECASCLLNYLTTLYDKKADMDYSHMWYPMCYLYRNTIELLLKSIIFEYSHQTLQTRCAVSYNNKHKLHQLLKNAQEFAFNYYEIEEKDDYIKNMIRYCELLHNFDSDSSKFRYPISKNGKPYLSRSLYYNFASMGNFLKALASSIDGIRGVIDDRKDAIETMRAEYSEY